MNSHVQKNRVQKTTFPRFFKEGGGVFPSESTSNNDGNKFIKDDCASMCLSSVKDELGTHTPSCHMYFVFSGIQCAMRRVIKVDT